MAGLKSLAKDTAVYGLSSILGRFLNYLLVPLYTAVLSAASGGYGVVANVYAYTALILVLLTFGMETGFFRFANKKEGDSQQVYANALLFVGGLSLLFWILGMTFLGPIAGFMEYPDHRDYIAMMMTVVAMDSFQCIPFAYLRYKKRPIKFAGIKLLNIAGNIALNLFFLLLCPWLMKHAPSTVDWFYDPDYQVGYIFVSNLMMSSLQLLFFIPEFRGFKYRIDPKLMKEMVGYSFPILIFGLVGILNQTIDKMIYPFLFDDRQEGLVQLGIFSACSKVALVMAMFTQAFRYAYEPFVFAMSKGKTAKAAAPTEKQQKQGSEVKQRAVIDSTAAINSTTAKTLEAEKAQQSDLETKQEGEKKMQSMVMKFFFIFALVAFLVIMAYMDILRYIIASDYWEGLIVVPIVMGSEIFKGIYFNLSFWYKLTDDTKWGAYFSLIGCAVILSLNIWLVPRYGYVASAWASFTGYAIITLLSYVIGQKHYPVKYPLKDMAIYLGLAAVLYVLMVVVHPENVIVRLGFNSLLLLAFVGLVVKKDFPLRSIPVIGRFFR